jgi:hypothetical protein
MLQHIKNPGGRKALFTQKISIHVVSQPWCHQSLTGQILWSQRPAFRVPSTAFDNRMYANACFTFVFLFIA